MALITYNFESQYLNQNEQVTIIVPDKPRSVEPADFFGSGEKYKVLWLLHGTYGDSTDWVRRSNIETYACEKNMIVVMPSALNSDYENWGGFAIGYNMYDFMIKELMPMIYNWFPASSRREDNFIAGLSMGGQGALSLALFNPALFGAMASLSYAPIDYHKHANGMELTSDHADLRFRNQVANMGGMDGFLVSPYNTWDRLFEEKNPDVFPKMFFTCGTRDFLWDYYKEFKQAVQVRKLDIAFREYEGFEHEWRGWDLAIQAFIDFIDPSEKDKGNKF